MRQLVAFCLAASVCVANPPLAQEQQPDFAEASLQPGTGPATLVADEVFVTAEDQLIAQGNVEAFQGGTKLTASRIVFDRAQGTLSIEGPIRLVDAQGITILANAAEMDDGLRNGLLSGARMVFDQHVQLASNQINRVGGRYTQLYKTAVTSCKICEDGRPPLWQIRATRVIHDQEERQLYFEDARLLVLDVPVFFVPLLRLPDPTLDRANGFLIPSIRTTSQLGTGFRVPYFFTLGDHADLTLAPYISPSTTTLDFRYRQAFRRGRIEFEGALTDDDLIRDTTRGYLFGTGAFDLPNDFKLTFDLKTTTDDAYLVDYGITNDDRLESQVALTRTNRDTLVGLSLINYKSLRDSEASDFVPSLVAEGAYQRRLFPGIGGELRLSVNAHAHSRDSDQDVAGRDIRRGTAEAAYLRSWITRIGLRTDLEMNVAVDTIDVRDDSNFTDVSFVTTPSSALTFRYPMTKRTERATHYLEPLLQIAWSDVMGDEAPNEESRFVEFDEGNLLALSRFPATDRREDGFRLAYGMNWSRYAADGWNASASVGQILRAESDEDFTKASGLDGETSDFLLAGQLGLMDELTLTARSLFDDSFEFSKAELRGDWNTERVQLSTSYLWLDEDVEEDRLDPVSEVWFDGTYEVDRHWSASANWRYDIADNRSTRAGLGLLYRNECVEVDLSVSRRFTSSTSVEPSTDFGFTIALRGFSVASGTEKHARSCS